MQRPGSRAPALRVWPEARKLAQKATAASVCTAVRACSQTKVVGISLGRNGFLSPAPHQVWALAALGQPLSSRCILTAHLPVWPQSKLLPAV